MWGAFTRICMKNFGHRGFICAFWGLVLYCEFVLYLVLSVCMYNCLQKVIFAHTKHRRVWWKPPTCCATFMFARCVGLWVAANWPVWVCCVKIHTSPLMWAETFGNYDIFAKWVRRPSNVFTIYSLFLFILYEWFVDVFAWNKVRDNDILWRWSLVE